MKRTKNWLFSLSISTLAISALTAAEKPINSPPI
jgi:hypothetical protein